MGRDQTALPPREEISEIESISATGGFFLCLGIELQLVGSGEY